MNISSAELASFLVLLGLSGFFSGAETALTSLSRVKVRFLIQQRGRRARRLQSWIDEPERYLTTLLICNNVVNVGASAMATTIAARVMGGGSMARAASIATGIMTFLLLIFGEITPKHFARRHAVPFSLLVIGPLHMLSIVLRPLEILLSWISGALLFVLSGGRTSGATTVTGAELKAMVALGNEAGVIKRTERRMIEGVLDFGDITVREIMVPRVKMNMLSVDATDDELARVVTQGGHRRIPVYEGHRDQVIGVLHLHDLLRQLLRGEPFDLRALASKRTPHFVPEAKPVDRMLAWFQRERTHLALVINEYGGIEGLITLEDVIEEIVGEINDEHDKPVTQIRELDESGCYELDGAVEVKEAARALDVEFGQTSAASVGGWLVEQLGHIPAIGEQHEVDGFEVSVADADDRVVKKIALRRLHRTESGRYTRAP